jgi:hypothetical protein
MKWKIDLPYAKYSTGKQNLVLFSFLYTSIVFLDFALILGALTHLIGQEKSIRGITIGCNSSEIYISYLEFLL